MIKSKINYLFLLITSITINQNIAAETISITADSWCPYNCNKEDKLQGYVVEIVKTVFERKGHNIDYQLNTWTDSIDKVRSGKIHGLIAGTVYDSPDFVFPKNSIGKARDCFYVKPEDKWNYSIPSDLLKRKLGVVESYSYARTKNDFIKNSPQLVKKANGINALENLNKFIIDKSIDTIVENPIVFNYYIYKNANVQKYEEAGCMEGNELFVAFSPANPKSKEYAKILSDGIEQLRNDGTLDRIVKKYSLTEWR